MDTVHTDQASRFILMCEALQSTREDTAFTAFQRLFDERCLPDAIRTDNGLPFASPNGLYNLSRLSSSPESLPRTAATSACISP